jgi:hypothetical protein
LACWPDWHFCVPVADGAGPAVYHCLLGVPCCELPGSGAPRNAPRWVDFSTAQSAVTTAVKPQLDQPVQSGVLSSQQESNALTRLTSGDARNSVHEGHHHHVASPLLASSPDTTSAPAVASVANGLGLLTTSSYSLSWHTDPIVVSRRASGRHSSVVPRRPTYVSRPARSQARSRRR